MQVLHKRAKNHAVPGGTFEKGPSKGVTNLCFFWKLRRPKLTRERQNDSRGVGGGIRVENINYSIIMCDAQWEKEGRRRENKTVSAAVGELCMTAMIDLWKEHTPKGYWKALNSWHQQTLRHWKGEERWRSKRSRRIQSKGKFFSFVIV